MKEQTPQYEEQTLTEGSPRDQSGPAVPPQSQKAEKHCH